VKVAISCTGENLDAAIDPRFGRCAYFLLVDTETETSQAIANPGAKQPGGAGVQSATTVVQQGAQAVICGNLGPKAAQTLTAAGVKAYASNHATPREALEHLRQQKLSPLN
jgi:predicted Fe-Mo cluster-binding NifX family protein